MSHVCGRILRVLNERSLQNGYMQEVVLCVSQDRLGCTAVTNKPLSIFQFNIVKFVTHIIIECG